MQATDASRVMRKGRNSRVTTSGSMMTRPALQRSSGSRFGASFVILQPTSGGQSNSVSSKTRYDSFAKSTDARNERSAK